VTTEFVWGKGKVSRVRQQFHDTDGELVAEVEACPACST